MAKELTPQQLANCQNIVSHMGTMQRFGITFESDLSDGVLSTQEKIELALGSTLLPGAVIGIINERRTFKKEDAATEALMLTKIGELTGTDKEGAGTKVALCFDFATKMSGVVATVLLETKTFVRQLRGEVIEPKARNPRTVKAVAA